MKPLFVFLALIAVFIGIIILAIKYFKWLLKTRQEGNKPNNSNATNFKKER